MSRCWETWALSCNDLKCWRTDLRSLEFLTNLFVEVNLGGRQIHDINIVATMLAHGEQRLLSLNTRHFRHFERHIQLITI